MTILKDLALVSEVATDQSSFMLGSNCFDLL